MKAIIHWHDGDPPTTCDCERRTHGSTRQGSTKSGATPFMLHFQQRWRRIYKLATDRARHYIVIDDVKHEVTFSEPTSTAAQTA